MIIFLFSSILSVHAQTLVNFRSEVSKVHVAPTEEFYAIHVISNMTGHDIVVRVTEWLDGAPDSFISEVTVKAGEELQRKGRTFNAANSAGQNVLRYRAEYRSIDVHEAWVELETNFFVVEAVIDTSVSVVYNARHGETVFRGQSVEFEVEIRSLGNVPISNIIVEDSSLGVIGEIPLLGVGETTLLTRSFVLDTSTQSHVILRFREPLTQSEIVRSIYDAEVRVEVSAQSPPASLLLVAKPDKEVLSRADEVTFEMSIKNTGEVEIHNIEVSDWENVIVHTIRRLMPGEERTFQYKDLIEAGKQYEFKARGQAQGIRNPVETTYITTITELSPLVEIEREVVEEPQPTLRYIIKNTGNVALVDVVIEELEVGVIARLERMEPGDTEQFTVNLDLDRDRISNPILIAKEAANMTIFRYQPGEMLIPAITTDKIPLISVDVKVEPRTLSSPGTVDMEFVVRNDGNVALKNVEIILKERNLTVGSLSEMLPGEQQLFELSDLEVDLSQSFTASVKSEDEQGNELVFESNPVNVSVEQRNASLGLTQAAEGARASFLRSVLGIIIILGILTLGGLIYFLKSSLIPMRRKKSHIG